MPTALLTRKFVAEHGAELKSIAERAGKTVSFITLPEEKNARLAPADCDRIDCSYLDRQINFNEDLLSNFDAAIVASKNVKWIHVTSSGINPNPFVTAVTQRGGTITSSTGANAEPVAQTGFTGLLMLARGFPSYVRSQHKREWSPIRGAALPNDLRGQTLLQIGVGAVGTILAGYARAFGLKVIGVRRAALKPGDPVDEMHHPSKLPELLPRADWIVVSCPLTKETRNLLDAEAFKRMKKGVRIINIGRGEVLDEEALLAGLKSGHVAGAHLDALTHEPLPADSPFWALPNVIVTPHNAAASTGNEGRSAQMFIANFGHWLRGEPMFNVRIRDGVML